ncbi:MAG TPA: tRNA uridine-5-carboxymethylaminomethyl(34) synthesis GTPase MnmE [Gemmatimonadaceae bacterium]|nr:tRNA uridine-5-carboxymethylaminomethyl(34) synthesis GTPase MnmE [Gemmatimonadaceae bacterium]
MIVHDGGTVRDDAERDSGDGRAADDGSTSYDRAAPLPVPVPLPGAGDTIAALATAIGRGALAVIRVSGPDAYAVAARVLTPWKPEPRTTWLATLRDLSSGKVVDHPVVTAYAAPRSYTGEDLVELSVHGGELVPVLALGALLAAGAREALPGEFTRRAVANGKMDVLQAEGVGDLIDAQSRAMHDAAIGQLEGSLSRRIAALRDAVIGLESLIAYDIDFPEEDDGPIPAERVERGIADLEAALDALLATAATGEMLRRGALVVIAGAPNAGKSSLFNAILGSTRAIVTDIPGTTRDAIEAVADVGSWPVRLVDTAGLRETSDVVERLGIEVSEQYLGDADAVLACGETEESLALTASRVRSLTRAPVLAVRTKADLVANRYQSPSEQLVAGSYQPATEDLVADCYQIAPVIGSADAAGDRVAEPRVAVSAATGAGLGALADTLARLLAERYGGVRGGSRSPVSDRSAPVLTRERHRVAVERARGEVADFARLWREGSLPATVAAVHLHAAATALESLIGGVDVEDVLDRIFSDFCVGK